MDRYVEVLNRYLAENPLELARCDVKSLLGMLYCCYHQRRGGDNKQISERFGRLNSILDKLPLQEQDQVVDLACALSSSHQKEAFEEGILVGFHLFRELTAPRAVE